MKIRTINRIESIITSIFKRIGINEPLVSIRHRADTERYYYTIQAKDVNIPQKGLSQKMILRHIGENVL